MLDFLVNHHLNYVNGRISFHLFQTQSIVLYEILIERLNLFS